MKKVDILDKSLGIRYKGYYLVDNIDDLLEIHNSLYHGHLIKTVQEFSNGEKHLVNKYAIAVQSFTESKYLVEGKVLSPIAAAAEFFSSLFKNQLKAILDGNKIAVNENGGYFIIDDTDKYDIAESSEKVYNEEDIKILQWPDGIHYYAKVGNLDVFIDGEQKWDSYGEAYEAALKFLENIRKEER